MLRIAQILVFVYSSLVSSISQEVIQIINFGWRYLIEAAILFQFTVLTKNI